VAVELAVLEACRQEAASKPVSATVSVITETSVARLLEKSPSLQALRIESCGYVCEKATPQNGLPPPSDTRLEIRGSAVLSGAGVDVLKSTLAWEPVTQDRIPAGLQAMLPPGNTLVSKTLNEAFTKNPTDAHGFVVLADGGRQMAICFLARDLDHPTE
jgi:hypothetical protein